MDFCAFIEGSWSFILLLQFSFDLREKQFPGWLRTDTNDKMKCGKAVYDRESSLPSLEKLKIKKKKSVSLSIWSGATVWAKGTTCFPTDNHTYLCCGWRVTSRSPSLPQHYSDTLSLVTVCKKKLCPASLCKEATPVNKSRFWQLPDPGCVIQHYSVDKKVFYGRHLACSGTD